MTKRNRIWQSWFLAAVIALGFAVTWGVVFISVGGFVTSAYQSNSDSWNTEITMDGTPVLRSYGPTGYLYETLDRKPIPRKKAPSIVNPARFYPAQKLSGWWTEYGWSGRIQVAQVSENVPAPVNWFLVYEGTAEGTAHFVGYDAARKLRIGYIGRDGFSAVKPTPENAFPIKPLSSYNALSQKYNFFNACYNVWYAGVSESVQNPAAYLVSGNQLLRIDLSKRTVSVVYEADDLVSICEASGAGMVTDDKPHGYRILKTKNKVVLFDLGDKQRGQFVLPKSLRKKDIQIWPIDEKSAVVLSTRRFTRTPLVKHIYHWLDNEGEITKEESIDLPNRSMNGGEMLLATAAMPIPTFITPGVLWSTADDYVSTGECPDYPSALAAAVSDMWPSLVFVNVLGIVFAVICYRRQRRYDQRWTWVWVITVFLFGLPGFVGYLAHRRWPPIKPCSNCDAAVPRDRPECYACGKEFPRPKIKGTEVFA